MKKFIALLILGVAGLISTGLAQSVSATNSLTTTTVYSNDTVWVESNQTPQTTRQDTRSKFYLGLKGGVNYSNVYDTQGENFKTDPKFGFAGGVFLTIPIGKYIGLQPEIVFSQKGFKGTGTLLGSSYSLTRTTNYIDVPILVAIKPSPGITLMAGPHFSYLLKQTDEFETGGFTDEQVQEFKNDNIRKNTLGFTGGIDFNFNHVVLGTRIGWDIKNNNGDGTHTTPRYKNVWLQATLGFRF
jgi:hypothetical protein